MKKRQRKKNAKKAAKEFWENKDYYVRECVKSVYPRFNGDVNTLPAPLYDEILRNLAKAMGGVNEETPKEKEHEEGRC